MRASWLLLPALSLALACGNEDGGGDGGDGGSAGEVGSASPAAGGAPGTGGMPGTGATQTCDDLGFCGQAEDPGCVTCSVTDGCCMYELEACDQSCHVGWHRCFKAHHLTRSWVGEGKKFRVKGLTRKIFRHGFQRLRQTVRFGAKGLAVVLIADDWMADMRHVDADLVRAAGFQPAFDQRGERVLGGGI